MAGLTVANPGPLARLEEVKADAVAPSMIFQRLTDRESLPQIAKSLQLPKGRFVEWFTTQHSELYDAALKVVAADLALEAMQAALDATPEDVAVRKLQADVALKLAARFDRARYGESVRVEKTVEVRADAGLVGLASDLLKRIRAPRVIEADRPALTAQEPI